MDVLLQSKELSALELQSGWFLWNLLFLYCALRAHIRFKYFINTVSHYMFAKSTLHYNVCIDSSASSFFPLHIHQLEFRPTYLLYFYHHFSCHMQCTLPLRQLYLVFRDADSLISTTRWCVRFQLLPYKSQEGVHMQWPRQKVELPESKSGLWCCVWLELGLCSVPMLLLLMLLLQLL